MDSISKSRDMARRGAGNSIFSMMAKPKYYIPAFAGLGIIAIIIAVVLKKIR